MRVITEEQRRAHNAARQKKYHAANPEKRREWRRLNKDKLAASARRWKEANPETRKKWHNANIGKVTAYRLRYRYNITVEERDAMFAAQDGKCAICSKIVKLNVDHCHETGNVRGGLCGKCNTALGRFEDNPDLLTAAITYLAKHQEKDAD